MTHPHCNCEEWQANKSGLQSYLQQTAIRFCPWCGKPVAQLPPKRDEALLANYRQRIEDDFFRTGDWGVPEPTNMMVTARSITDYRQETGDILGTLDLMLTFVEMGTRFTDQYGDIDEPFYEALEIMLEDFTNLLFENEHLYAEGDLSLRLEKLVRAAGWMGWGYGDFVTDQVGKIQKRFGG